MVQAGALFSCTCPLVHTYFTILRTTRCQDNEISCASELVLRPGPAAVKF
jgi:hypothetical protein